MAPSPDGFVLDGEMGRVSTRWSSRLGERIVVDDYEGAYAEGVKAREQETASVREDIMQAMRKAGLAGETRFSVSVSDDMSEARMREIAGPLEDKWVVTTSKHQWGGSSISFERRVTPAS